MSTQARFGISNVGISTSRCWIGHKAKPVTLTSLITAALTIVTTLVLTCESGVATPVAMAGGGSLTITIDGLKSQEGYVCLALFANSQDFPMRGEKALRNECFKVSGSTMQVTLKGLTPGTYAIAALHDANGDRQANRNRLGMPTEGFGFSQNPSFSFGPPSFEEACFRLSGKGTQVSVQIHYLIKG